ncbi:Crp/Fnr family transcriptional regulator [Pedobacter sp. GR22-6]|uniref:Crp/Fnr family transcriptional regulator n=1 Tax=Pedobacter sp. GR22-6 TaxID=3127957 RepID=UPI00307DFA12
MISEHAFRFFLRTLEKFQALDPLLNKKLRTHLHETESPRGEIMLRTRTQHPVLYFIISGSAREVTIHPQTGNAETTWMWFPGDFVYTKPGFFSQQPSASRVETMEESILLYVEKEHFDQLESEFGELRPLTERVRDHYHQLLKAHAFALAASTNQERYDQFVRRRPKALATLNHKHIASFLGIRDKGLDRYSQKK